MLFAAAFRSLVIDAMARLQLHCISTMHFFPVPSPPLQVSDPLTIAS